MTEIGKTNILTIIKQVDFGMYLNGDNLGEILIPRRYIPKNTKVGDQLEVFIFLDSDDRIIATTEKPYVEIGKSAHLKVVGTSQFGSFMDWGLSKNLLVPFKEQRTHMIKGKSYTVFVFLDVTGRIAASSKLSTFLKEKDDDNHFTEAEKVTLQIASHSDLGYKTIINDTHLGLIHNSDLLQPINLGDNIDGYIKKIRQDGKIDLTLQATGTKNIDALTLDILEYIKTNGGKIHLTDKSPAEDIYKTFKISKTIYKKALGRLYRDRLIIIKKNEIALTTTTN